MRDLPRGRLLPPLCHDRARTLRNGLHLLGQNRSQSARHALPVFLQSSICFEVHLVRHCSAHLGWVLRTLLFPAVDWPHCPAAFQECLLCLSNTLTWCEMILLDVVSLVSQTLYISRLAWLKEEANHPITQSLPCQGV